MQCNHTYVQKYHCKHCIFPAFMDITDNIIFEKVMNRCLSEYITNTEDTFLTPAY